MTNVFSACWARALNLNRLATAGGWGYRITSLIEEFIPDVTRQDDQFIIRIYVFVKLTILVSDIVWRL